MLHNGVTSTCVSAEDRERRLGHHCLLPQPGAVELSLILGLRILAERERERVANQSTTK